MYYMVLLILNNIEQSPDVLDAWEEAAVPGITILESTGLGTVRARALREDIPLMPSLRDLFRSQEHKHRTLFTVVEDEAMVDRLIEVTRKTIGDLEQPHNGVLFVLPVSRAVGLKGAQARASAK